MSSRVGPVISEDALWEQLRSLAAMYGWRIYHTHDSRRSEPGFPDVVAVHRDRGFLVAELKSEKGRLSREQELWLSAFEEVGVETHVWRPAHLQEMAWRFGPRGHRTVDVGAIS
jgi:hypothetical protein